MPSNVPTIFYYLYVIDYISTTTKNNRYNVHIVIIWTSVQPIQTSAYNSVVLPGFQA